MDALSWIGFAVACCGVATTIAALRRNKRERVSEAFRGEAGDTPVAVTAHPHCIGPPAAKDPIVESNSCGVCYEDMTAATEIPLECAHVFCNVCVRKLAGDGCEGVTCPYCRRVSWQRWWRWKPPTTPTAVSFEHGATVPFFVRPFGTGHRWTRLDPIVFCPEDVTGSGSANWS